MISYYDLVLGFIPAALLGITGVLAAVGMPFSGALPIGAGVSLLAMGHALFVNGPVDELPPRDAPARASMAPDAD